MDPVSHTLVGLGIAWAAPHRLRSRATAAVLVVSSNLPDLDLLWAVVGAEAATLHRRTLSHSLAGVVLLAPLCALALRRKGNPQRVWHLAVWALVGGAAHVLLDLANSFGVALLAPFSMRRFELGLVFVVDPVIWLLGLVPLLAWYLRPKLRPRAAGVGLAAITAYLALCGVARIVAVQQLDDALRADGIHAESTVVFPEPFGPHRWSAAGRQGTSYRLYLVRPLTGQVEALGVIDSASDDPLVAKVRRDPAFVPVRSFLRAPVWRTDGDLAQVRDLRFTYRVLGNEWDPFRFTFRVDGGKVEMTHLPAASVRQRAFSTLRSMWRPP